MAVEIKCPACRALNAAESVTVNLKPWAGSPAPWLSGYFSDLESLIAQGMARRNSSGWIEPTEKFPRALA